MGDSEQLSYGYEFLVGSPWEAFQAREALHCCLVYPPAARAVVDPAKRAPRLKGLFMCPLLNTESADLKLLLTFLCLLSVGLGHSG